MPQYIYMWFVNLIKILFKIFDKIKHKCDLN